MILAHAIQTLGITKELITLEDVKKSYREAARIYHPDINKAGLETMKIVNEAHETLLKENYPIEYNKNEDASENYGKEINEALNKIINIPDIEIEIIGSWVWVSGETKKHKDTLGKNGAGFKWSNNKKMWCFRPRSDRRRYSGNQSIDDIRATYGSSSVRQRYRKKIIA